MGISQGFRSALWVILFSLSTSALSTTEAPDQLRLSLNHWPPFGLSEQRPYQGIDYDVATELARRMGLSVSVIPCSFKRCLAAAKAGQIDLIGGIAKNTERIRYLQYLSPHYSVVSVAFYLPSGTAHKIESYSDLFKLRIGSVSKSHYFSPFNEDKRIQKVEVPTEAKLLNLLKAGRIDAIIGTNPNIEYQASQLNMSAAIKPANFDPDANVKIFFAIPRASRFSRGAKEFSQILTEMIDDGTIDEITLKYR